MIIRILLYFLLFVLVIVESTLYSFPFVLTASLITYLLFPRVSTLVIIFLAAFALDVVRIYNIGVTPLVIFVIIAALSFNSKIFDIRDYLYILGVSVLGSIIYANIMNYHINLVLLGMMFGMAVLAGSFILKGKKKIISS